MNPTQKQFTLNRAASKKQFPISSSAPWAGWVVPSGEPLVGEPLLRPPAKGQQVRVLMLNWRDPCNPRAGGAERVSLKHLAAMIRRGHSVTWFSHQFQREPLLEYYGPPILSEPFDEIDGIKVVRAYSGLRSVLAARKWTKSQPRFDLVIDQQHGIPWYAPLWCKTAVISYLHEVLDEAWNEFYRWPLNWIGKQQEKFTLHAYRNIRFWCPSRSTADTISRLGVKSVEVIPNGCDTEPLKSLPPKEPAETLRLITLSRISPNKRIEDAILTCRLIEESGRRVELTVVGTGHNDDYLRHVREVAANCRCKVNFTGFVSEAEKERLLQEAHVLLHPSVCEGWGLNVIEANAMGTPAVAYPSPGLMDSILPGLTGEIATAKNPHALACAVEHACRNYKFLRSQAWEWSKKFQWPTILPRVCDWLETCAMRPNGLTDGSANNQ